MLTKRGKRLSAVGVLVAAFAAIMIPAPVRWRAEVVLLSLAGRIPDIELKQLLAYMMPGSGQWLRPLIETHNPYAVIRNVKTTPADIQAGATLFRSECAECHAPDGSGGRGPRLIGRQFTHGESDWAVYRTIRFGIPNTTMGPHPLPDTAVWQLEAFVRSIDTSGSTLGATARGSRGAARVPVPYDELAAIREPGEDWLTYSGSYWSSRHSALSQINRGNVGHVALRWIHQLEGATDCVEVSPVVRKGIMFVTQPPSRVLALDATTGTEIWAYDHQVSRTVPRSDVDDFSVVANRGVAVTLPLFAIQPPVEVVAVDTAGNTVTSFTGFVTIAIGKNGGLLFPGTLSGTKTVAAVNGSATFSDLSIDQPGIGYTLVVTASSLTGAESASFNVLTPSVLP